MRFFSAIPFIALLAGATFAAPSTVETDLTVRTNTPCRSVKTIVVELHENLKPHCGQLTAITADTATVGQIKPICDKISGLVTGAAGEIKLLKGQSASVIFGVENGAQVSVAMLATTLCALFTLVISACGSVLMVAGSNFAACQGALGVVAQCVANMYTLIFSICGTQLQSAFFGGIHSMIPTCYSLQLFSFLNDCLKLNINMSGIVGGVCNTITKLMPF